VLLDGGDCERRRELLDVGSDEEGVEGLQGETADLAPGEEAAYGRAVGPPGVGLRISAVKNSTNRRRARSPAAR
jgi:hypothetical protein